MVKIVDGDARREILKNRKLELKGLARKFFPQEKFLANDGNIIVMSDIESLYALEINASAMLIHVYVPEYFDVAEKIAKVYEEHHPDEEELIIETDYSAYRSAFNRPLYR